MEIGQKIKHYRLLNGLTQDELASRCEVSKGFLSQIENDLTSPSIATLSDIVEALGLDMASFFADWREEAIVFSKEDYFVDEDKDSCLTWLVPNAQKNQMEPIYLELGAYAQSEEVTPFEGECFGYILEGSVSLVYAQREEKLSSGDTFYVHGRFAHYLKNEEAEKAKIIWVSTPPNF